MSASHLKTLLSSTAKRQSLLASVPPATRALPAAALVASDIASRQGWSVGGVVRDQLLGGSGGDEGAVLLGAPGEVDGAKDRDEGGKGGVVDGATNKGNGEGYGEVKGEESVESALTATADTGRTSS